MNSNIDKNEEYFKNNLNYNTFELLFKINDSNIMINYEDVKKILNCKKDILINLLINKKNNFNENIDYEISSIKNINLSINTIKHICLMKNNLYREYHLNNENTLLLNNININKKINTVNNFFDNNNIDDFFNKYIYYIIKLNDNIYSYGSTFTILKTFNSYKKLYDNNKQIYFIKCWDVKNIQISKKIDIDFKKYINNNNIEFFIFENTSFECFKYNNDELKLIYDIELYINENIKQFNQLYENK